LVEDSRYYYGIGMEKLDKGNIEEALEYFAKSIEIRPHFKTYERMFHIYKRLNKITEARMFIEKAFKMNKSNDKIALEYAECLICDGMIELAEKVINDILNRNNSYGPAIRLLATIK
jgi:tetratricopeptide (TPR) repeat protein